MGPTIFSSQLALKVSPGDLVAQAAHNQVCTICEQTFLNKDDLTLHMKTYHEASMTEHESGVPGVTSKCVDQLQAAHCLPCSFCDETFQTEEELNQHVETYHDTFLTRHDSQNTGESTSDQLVDQPHCEKCEYT